MAEDRHIYGEINNKTDLREVFKSEAVSDCFSASIASTLGAIKGSLRRASSAHLTASPLVRFCFS